MAHLSVSHSTRHVCAIPVKSQRSIASMPPNPACIPQSVPSLRHVKDTRRSPDVDPASAIVLRISRSRARSIPPVAKRKHGFSVCMYESVAANGDNDACGGNQLKFASERALALWPMIFSHQNHTACPNYLIKPVYINVPMCSPVLYTHT